MDKLKLQLQQALVANVIKDKLKTNDKIIFSESACTMDRCIRFTTPALRGMMLPVKTHKSVWNTGDFMMYECSLNHKDFIAECCISIDTIPKEYNAIKERLFAAFPAIMRGDGIAVIRQWRFDKYFIDNNAFFEDFDSFIEHELIKFETSLNKAPEEIKEGEEKVVSSVRYERNPLARKICLEYQGYTCKVCGMDFKSFYGTEFENIIEVHHIVPISEIGAEYIVDPVNDLVPVCPNCHTVLHSKKDGVYTVEELALMRE